MMTPIRVLIAEDDTTTRALLSAHVRRAGYAMHAVANGRAAWEAFQAEPFDLVIADWLMPEVDGLELCRRVRERAGDESFVMVVTSRDGTEDLRAALAAGADDYLVKPVAAEQFHARLVIAERRLALSRARRIAEAEAASMRWLAGIGQTVLTLQHEINNPLTALYGSLEALLEAPDLPGHLAYEADRARAQAERIAGVVSRLATLKDPSTVELIPGVPMLALPNSTKP